MKKLIPTLTLTALLGSFLHAEPDAPTDRARKEAPRLERPDWDSIKKRIEGAIERGDLTRDQANQKYAEIKKKMVIRHPGPQIDRAGPKPEVRPDGPARRIPMRQRPGLTDAAPGTLGQVLGALVQQGKINRMEAARIRQAALAMRPPAPPHGGPKITDHHGPAPHEALAQVKGEMKDLLEAARQEFAQIREIRRNLQEARHHQEREMAEHHLEAARREIAEQREALENERNEINELRERLENQHREMAEHREALEREAHERREREQQMREQAEGQRREAMERHRRVTGERARTARQDRQREERVREEREERRQGSEEREREETREREE